MSGKEIISLSAFVFLIIGTIGLLMNEFFAGWGRAATLSFAVFNVVGLATLAFLHWGMKKE